jgi:pimeloyl-ACP methyl ester carboxylesterase
LRQRSRRDAYREDVPSIVVDGLSMYYEEAGAGDRLVLIGGLGIDVSEIGRLIDALAAHYRVLAFDNRGAGRTDKPDVPYTLSGMAEDTTGLMRAVGIERAHIVGFSMGGRIALELALNDPELVRSLILVSTSARVTRRWRVRLLGLFATIPVFQGSHRQPRYAFNRQRGASVGYDATARLAELHVPTAVMHGRRDHIVRFALAEELRDAVSGATLQAALCSAENGGWRRPMVRGRLRTCRQHDSRVPRLRPRFAAAAKRG